jgi:DNA-binding NtrC family response regulator
MESADYHILLVDDEEHMVTTMEFLLKDRYRLSSAHSVAEARTELSRNGPNLLLLDLGLPDGTGLDLLREIRDNNSPLDVIVITGQKDVGTAVQVMKLGAIDYVQKPFEREDLLLCIQRAFRNWELASRIERLQTNVSELSGPFHFGNIIATSPRMLDVISIARKMARSDATVLITGESGTGKELVASAIHWDGTRSDSPFVAVNCAQFTGTLLESELFGHERGAFTGATEQRKGRFELANTGTLFLDEVGNTSLEMQAKILRVVETKKFERVGGQKSVEVDERLIAATNADLREYIRQGKFREDLYYRLNVVRIEIAPLRERREDIPALCEHFLARHGARTGRRLRGITPEAMGMLHAYDWRGNVRELQNVLEMAVALEEGDWITTRYLPEHVLAAGCAEVAGERGGGSVLEGVVENFERRFLEEQLRVNDWNHRQTARALGVHRNTIENKIKKYGIREEKPELA